MVAGAGILIQIMPVQHLRQPHREISDLPLQQELPEGVIVAEALINNIILIRKEFIHNITIEVIPVIEIQIEVINLIIEGLHHRIHPVHIQRQDHQAVHIQRQDHQAAHIQRQDHQAAHIQRQECLVVHPQGPLQAAAAVQAEGVNIYEIYITANIICFYPDAWLIRMLYTAYNA